MDRKPIGDVIAEVQKIWRERDAELAAKVRARQAKIADLAEWDRLDQEHRDACAADEREVSAGRLDKNTYIERDMARAAAVRLAKQTLELQALSRLAEDGE